MDEIKRPESLTKYIEKTKYRIFVPFVVLNYPFRWLAYFLDKVAFLKILEYVGLLSVIVAVYFYYTERGDRQKAKHYQAWQVINLAQGKPGEGGRTAALQDLYKDGISLANIDLSKATIPNIYLRNANLWGANLSGAFLDDANLSGADLRLANLSRARLWNANLSGAKLAGANLSMADLSNATLSGAHLEAANLSKANLFSTNFSKASLWHANLSGAGLTDANLSGANLTDTNLSGAHLIDSNFSDANLYGSILSGAYINGTILSRANLKYAILSGAILCESNIDSIENWIDIYDIKNSSIYKVENAPDGFIEWATKHGAHDDYNYYINKMNNKINSMMNELDKK